MIEFACANCGKPLRVAEDRAGKRGKCPSCGQKTRIPQPAGAAVNFGSGGSLSGTGRITPATGGSDSGSRRRKEVTPGDFAFLAPAQEPEELGRLGHYRVLRILGAGGMGIVFEAEDTQLQRRVALKAMRLGVLTPANRERFLHEARATAAIEHDHIVTIYQVGEDNGVPYLAMQLLLGQSLEDKLKEEGGWLPVPEVLRIGREIAEGLEAAHAKGLIHRDIKPANIWLEGARGRVKIVDFGLARAAATDLNLTQEGLVMGTPAYMAPEQADDKPLDLRCDLFSLGCVLYRAATGQFPFRGRDSMAIMMAVATKRPDPPREIDPMVPARLSELIMQLLAKDPDERPQSAQAVREAIEAIESELVKGSPAPKPPAPPKGEEDLLPIEEETGDLKPDPDEDVVLLELDDSAQAAEEVEEVEEAAEVEEVEEAPPARPRTGPRRKRRDEKEQEEPGWERPIIIIGAIVAGAIVLLIAFLFIRRAMRSEQQAMLQLEHPTAAVQTPAANAPGAPPQRLDISA